MLIATSDTERQQTIAAIKEWVARQEIPHG